MFENKSNVKVAINMHLKKLDKSNSFTENDRKCKFFSIESQIDKNASAKVDISTSDDVWLLATSLLDIAYQKIPLQYLHSVCVHITKHVHDPSNHGPAVKRGKSR